MWLPVRGVEATRRRTPHARRRRSAHPAPDHGIRIRRETSAPAKKQWHMHRHRRGNRLSSSARAVFPPHPAPRTGVTGAAAPPWRRSSPPAAAAHRRQADLRRRAVPCGRRPPGRRAHPASTSHRPAPDSPMRADPDAARTQHGTWRRPPSTGERARGAPRCAPAPARARAAPGAGDDVRRDPARCPRVVCAVSSAAGRPCSDAGGVHSNRWRRRGSAVLRCADRRSQVAADEKR